MVRRLEGLFDEPRPGAKRTVTDDKVEAVMVKTLEDKPANGATHWPTRSTATAKGMSQTSISLIWRPFGFAAASGGKLQVVPRPALRGEGP